MKSVTQKTTRTMKERRAVDPNAVVVPVEEAAARLGISRSYCYRLILGGRLASIRLGSRCRRVPVSAIASFVAEQLAEEA